MTERPLAEYLTAEEIELALRALGALADGHELDADFGEPTLDVVQKLRLLI